MEFCDLKCLHARIPKGEMDGAGSCMTFTAIYCDLHGRHVMKAQPCSDRVERDVDLAGSRESGVSPSTKLRVPSLPRESKE